MSECAHPACRNVLAGKSTRKWCSERCRSDARKRASLWPKLREATRYSDRLTRGAQRARERAA